MRPSEEVALARKHAHRVSVTGVGIAAPGIVGLTFIFGVVVEWSLSLYVAAAMFAGMVAGGLYGIVSTWRWLRRFLRERNPVRGLRR